jgi:hypothetical protein
MGAIAGTLDGEAIVDVVKDVKPAEDETGNEDELLSADETGNEDEDAGEGETNEVDVIKPKAEGSQPTEKVVTQQQLDTIMGRRVKKEKGKTEQVTSELAAAQEVIKLQKIALEQNRNKPKALERPVATEFAGGADDAEYIKKLDDYYDAKQDARLESRIGKSNDDATANAAADAKSAKLAVKQEEHYKRAIQFGAKDFAATEDAAIEILGDDVVNEVINNFDDSQVILYYLGKAANKVEAEQLASLIKSNAVQGVAALGALRQELKVVTNGKTPAPNPDDELEGAVAGSKLTQRGPKGAKFE